MEQRPFGHYFCEQHKENLPCVMEKHHLPAVTHVLPTHLIMLQKISAEYTKMNCKHRKNKSNNNTILKINWLGMQSGAGRGLCYQGSMSCAKIRVSLLDSISDENTHSGSGA